MTDLLIIAGCSVASAFLGIALFGGHFIRQATKARMIANWERDARQSLVDTIERALDEIPPYTRSANGTVQKIGKILRGEG
ncbi:hypothetical protein M2336_001689 [Sphingobium sp. B1D7B]|uniref:hypothetical protein n=1 Tax=Sphingobium sp. B1D7B TaxID=2940578 RepID=UPI002224C724|nr:hypothetical protein [Sphingobium sp. B1D7B]MCW2405060.1 hypothetical protein [Sphingobium sp. B1D7B]